MNQVKIIKRSSLPLPLSETETNAKPLRPQIAKRRAAQIVASWINEWRASQSKDARRDFDDLFRRSVPTTEFV